jgi:hypothetical protein
MTPMERILNIGGIRARIVAEDTPEILEIISRAYGRFLSRARTYSWDITVSKKKDGFRIRDETFSEYRVEKPEQAWLALDQMLRAKFISQEKGRKFLFHTGVVSKKGRGAVMLLGASGSGKSSVVSALVAQGWRFLTDELVQVTEEGRAVAFPRLPEVGPKMAARLTGRWSCLEHIYSQGKPSGFLELPGNRIGAPGKGDRIRALVFLDRHKKPVRPSLTRVTGGQAVMETVRNSFNCYRFGPEGVEFAADIVERCRAYRLKYHDVITHGPEISEQLRRLL